MNSPLVVFGAVILATILGAVVIEFFIAPRLRGGATRLQKSIAPTQQTATDESPGEVTARKRRRSVAFGAVAIAVVMVTVFGTAATIARDNYRLRSDIAEKSVQRHIAFVKEAETRIDSLTAGLHPTVIESHFRVKDYHSLRWPKPDTLQVVELYEVVPIGDAPEQWFNVLVGARPDVNDLLDIGMRYSYRAPGETQFTEMPRGDVRSEPRQDWAGGHSFVVSLRVPGHFASNQSASIRLEYSWPWSGPPPMLAYFDPRIYSQIDGFAIHLAVDAKPLEFMLTPGFDEKRQAFDLLGAPSPLAEIASVGNGDAARKLLVWLTGRELDPGVVPFLYCFGTLKQQLPAALVYQMKS